MITTINTTDDEFNAKFREIVELWMASSDTNWSIVIDDVELALDYRDQRAGPYRIVNDLGRVVGFNDSAKDFLRIGYFVYQYVKEEIAE